MSEIRLSIVRQFSILAACASLANCAATTSFRPAPQKLADWSIALADAQPDDAFVAVYKVGHRYFVFIGAEHANDIHSHTFRLIADTYRTYHFDTVIGEGWPTSFGPNNKRVVPNSSEPITPTGFQSGGETVPTVRGARAQGATIWGGEIDDAAVKDVVAHSGVSPVDLLGFYVLRYIPQAIREREIDDAADPRLKLIVEQQLARNRQHLSIAQTVLPTYDAWAEWYRTLQGKPIGKIFDPEETGPLVAGPFRSNTIAHAVSRARDTHLHKLAIEHVNAKESVLVIFGGSHLMIQRPAFDAVLGQPCYFGPDIVHSLAVCR